MKNNNPVVPRQFLVIFAMLVSCFALWGLLNNMTDNLVPAFQKIFGTSQSTAGFVQISFYGAYSVIAIFASLLIQKAGYRVGVLVGLGVYCIGALLYVPACVMQSLGHTLPGFSSSRAVVPSLKPLAILTFSLWAMSPLRCADSTLRKCLIRSDRWQGYRWRSS
jgi:MFS family permease